MERGEDLIITNCASDGLPPPPSPPPHSAPQVTEPVSIYQRAAAHRSISPCPERNSHNKLA